MSEFAEENVESFLSLELKYTPVILTFSEITYAY